jgi:hypothetical protein
MYETLMPVHILDLILALRGIFLFGRLCGHPCIVPRSSFAWHFMQCSAVHRLLICCRQCGCLCPFFVCFQFEMVTSVIHSSYCLFFLYCVLSVVSFLEGGKWFWSNALPWHWKREGNKKQERKIIQEVEKIQLCHEMKLRSILCYLRRH